MRIRKVTIITIIGLIITLILQIGGLFYAYRSNMEAMQLTVNKNFAIAFYETNDNLANQLPYPDGTTIAYIPTAPNSKLSQDEQNLRTNEDLAQILKTEYKVEFPIDELATVLRKKLKIDNIDSEVVINKINNGINRILDSTNPTFDRKVGVLKSEPFFIDRSNQIAVQAIMVSPYTLILEKISLFYLLTFGLMIVVIYSIISQIKRIIRQQQSIKAQEKSFYKLAENMATPVTGIQKKMELEQWQAIENESNTLLGMTEDTLTAAKEAARKSQEKKQRSSRILSTISLTGTFLLLAIWFGFLYHTGYTTLKHEVNTYFEEAFFKEVGYHQFPQYMASDEKKEILNYPETGLTPFARRQKEEAARTQSPATRVYVFHQYNSIDANYTLRSALKMLEAINSCATPAPFSLQYMDSAFTARLYEAGITRPTCIDILTYPDRETEESTCPGHAARISDLATRFIPLNNDSSKVIQGRLSSPQVLILMPLWPLLLSLGLMFLLIACCVFYQVKMIFMQRRLALFQRDFTYAMIHDMKSPLNTILMGAHILNTGKLEEQAEKKKKYLQAISDECNHLLTLSNRVILLTQIEKDELQLHKETVVLEPLIDDLIEKFRLKTHKPVEFSKAFHHCNSVYADAFCLREILSNLIDNAIKYSGETVKIDIVCEEESNYTKIKVHDNGLGISFKEQNKIFDKFERADAGKRSNAGGFGLGLNYVQRVMTAHNGKVSLESIENKFSEFTLFFPVRDN